MHQRRRQHPLNAEEDLAKRGRESGGKDLGGVGPLLEGARSARADIGGGGNICKHILVCDALRSLQFSVNILPGAETYHPPYLHMSLFRKN